MNADSESPRDRARRNAGSGRPPAPRTAGGASAGRAGGSGSDRRPVRSSDGRPPRPDSDRRPPRREEDASKPRMDVPEIPDDVTFAELDKVARARLRTLSKDNAEDVGRHLVMAGRLIDDDPETAHRHALVAVARAGRVDIVREAAALTAYATGRYADALRELRTVRRLNGSSEHLALMADCERGLGRPERALALAADPEVKTLSAQGRMELDIVLAGARFDMGELEAALFALSRIAAPDAEARDRIDEARVPVLEALGRAEEAAAIEARLAPDLLITPYPDDDLRVFDTAEMDAPVEADTPETAPELVGSPDGVEPTP